MSGNSPAISEIKNINESNIELTDSKVYIYKIGDLQNYPAPDSFFETLYNYNYLKLERTITSGDDAQTCNGMKNGKIVFIFSNSF